MGKRLTRSEIDTFREHGFLPGIDVFGEDDCDAFRSRVEAFEQTRPEAVGWAFDIKTNLLFDWVHDLGCDPRLLDLIEDLPPRTSPAMSTRRPSLRRTSASASHASAALHTTTRSIPEIVDSRPVWTFATTTVPSRPLRRHVAIPVDAGGDELRFRWTPFDAVADNDYNVTASRYKPRVAEAVPNEDSSEPITKVPAMAHEITAEFEKLLDEVE